MKQLKIKNPTIQDTWDIAWNFYIGPIRSYKDYTAMVRFHKATASALASIDLGMLEVSDTQKSIVERRIIEAEYHIKVWTGRMVELDGRAVQVG